MSLRSTSEASRHIEHVTRHSCREHEMQASDPSREGACSNHGRHKRCPLGNTDRWIDSFRQTTLGPPSPLSTRCHETAARRPRNTQPGVLTPALFPPKYASPSTVMSPLLKMAPPSPSRVPCSPFDVITINVSQASSNYPSRAGIILCSPSSVQCVDKKKHMLTFYMRKEAWCTN